MRKIIVFIVVYTILSVTVVYAQTAQLWETGQTKSYNANDDGVLKRGLAWPDPRFTDNSNGTITDNLTGLVWLKNAGCIGSKNWSEALSTSNSLTSGQCGLSDGSKAGDWRLPNRKEFRSLIDYGNDDPALPSNHPFSGVNTSGYYWSSTTYASTDSDAWSVYMWNGYVAPGDKYYAYYVWPVRSGQVGNLVNLVISRSGTGSGAIASSDGKINCGSDCSESYNSGSSVTLTATADAGSTFSGWSGGGCTGTGSCSITITSDVTVTATFAASATSTPTPTPTATPTPTPTIAPTVNSKAIIVAGGGPYEGNNLWESTMYVADAAYNTLLVQGFDSGTIKYLSADTTNPDVTDSASNENLKKAISEWALDASNIIFYMTDHGGFGTFRMSEKELLKAADLRAWLDDMQGKTKGLVVFVYDACQSGSFLAYLVPPSGMQRILISSAKQEQQAVFASSGLISFSTYFWNQVLTGANLYTAYTSAARAVAANFGQRSSDSQTPVLDDNGDGISDKTDGDLARTYKIGKGVATAADVPVISSASTEPTALTGTTSAKIIVNSKDIVATAGLYKLWALIMPPDLETGSTATPITDLPSVELTYSSEKSRYEGEYTNFTSEGTYDITVYALDNGGHLSAPASASLTQSMTTSANPKPSIKANGKDDSTVSLSTTDTLELTVSIDPGGKEGEDVDYWLYAYTPFGTYHYTLTSGWVTGYAVTYQSGLIKLSPYPVLTYKGLPAGNYLFTFEIDNIKNGTRDGDVYIDSVVVDVQ